MEFFRHWPRSSLVLKGVMMTMVLLCLQGVNLHVHGTDHGDGEAAHSLGQAHSAFDLSHVEEHHGSVYDVDLDVSLSSLVFSDISVFLALFSLLCLLFFLGPVRVLVRERRDHLLIFYEHCSVLPPLRAPPL